MTGDIVIATPRIEPRRAVDSAREPGWADSDVQTRNLRVLRSTDRASADDTSLDDVSRTESVDVKATGPLEAYPEPGTRVDGFAILSELGRGSMGRVYLARQSAPTERTVVLKVGPHLSSECQKLAKLQHANIVPVYSFHAWGSVQAVCMPYRGPVTLAHLVTRLRDESLPTLNGRALTTAIDRCRKERPVPVARGDAPTAAHTGAALARVRGLSFVDAVLTVVRQIVEGLRVAHAAGIVHGDLKPANVLLADDGTAQLIDFGVAIDDSDRTGPIRIGGTRPYMSPEQLRSFRNANRDFDSRSDLYAAGVVLYELLTGRYPYEYVPDSNPNALDWDISNRYRPPASVRAGNASVPPAVVSIVARCLAADVAHRYQAAVELREDLDRQLSQRPLRYAPNPSRPELVKKWVSRHRAILIATGGLGVAIAGSAAIAARDARNGLELTRLRVAEASDAFIEDVENAQFAFALAESDPASRVKAWDSARRALGRFDAGDDDQWYLRPTFASVPDDRVTDLRRRTSGLMTLLANDRVQTALRDPSADGRSQGMAEARLWNERAAATHPHADGGIAAGTQRIYLDRLANVSVETVRPAVAPVTSPDHPDDGVTVGRQLLAEGRYKEALSILTGAAKAEPKHYWPHFYAAVCRQHLGEFREAVGGYDICASLRPGYAGTEFNRGACRMRLGQYAEAEQDFGRALAARPDWADAAFQRAIAREAGKDYAGAVADLALAFERGYSPTNVYLARSRVYGRMGNRDAADRDARDGLRAVPTDERGWLARAQARLFRDPAAARADYDQCLALNPRNTIALQGLAHAIAVLGDDRAVVDVLTKLIAIDPTVSDAWSGRAVHRARLKDRDGAFDDAREALRLSDRPATKYQVAGVYATTARENPDDRREAFSLLDAALRGGFGFEHLATDPELDPLRADPEFTKTVDAARAFRAALKRVD